MSFQFRFTDEGLARLDQIGMKIGIYDRNKLVSFALLLLEEEAQGAIKVTLTGEAQKRLQRLKEWLETDEGYIIQFGLQCLEDMVNRAEQITVGEGWIGFKDIKWDK